MNGWELMQELENFSPRYAIAVSGYGMKADREMSAEAGFRHHLVKPLLPHKLDERLCFTTGGKDTVPQLFEILPKSIQCVLVILDYKYAQRKEITGADKHTGNRFPRPWQP